MSFLLSGPILFVDDDELAACIEILSERIRRDAVLRPALDRLVGNRWADAERQAYYLFHATLFRDERPKVDANWLARAARALSSDQVDRLADILLSCVFETFPVHSAGDLCDHRHRACEDAKVHYLHGRAGAAASSVEDARPSERWCAFERLMTFGGVRHSPA